MESSFDIGSPISPYSDSCSDGSGDHSLTPPGDTDLFDDVASVDPKKADDAHAIKPSSTKARSRSRSPLPLPPPPPVPKVRPPRLHCFAHLPRPPAPPKKTLLMTPKAKAFAVKTTSQILRVRAQPSAPPPAHLLLRAGPKAMPKYVRAQPSVPPPPYLLPQSGPKAMPTFVRPLVAPGLQPKLLRPSQPPLANPKPLCAVPVAPSPNAPKELSDNNWHKCLASKLHAGRIPARPMPNNSGW